MKRLNRTTIHEHIPKKDITKNTTFGPRTLEARRLDPQPWPRHHIALLCDVVVVFRDPEVEPVICKHRFIETFRMHVRSQHSPTGVAQK